MKSDVILLTCVFQKIIKVSIIEFDINPLYSVSLPGHFWQCVLKYTIIRLQTLQDTDMILLLDNNTRGVGDRYVKPNEKNIKHLDANIL